MKLYRKLHRYVRKHKAENTPRRKKDTLKSNISFFMHSKSEKPTDKTFERSERLYNHIAQHKRSDEESEKQKQFVCRGSRFRLAPPLFIALALFTSDLI